jgi:glucose-1-phosphate thymidylyltransferase
MWGIVQVAGHDAQHPTRSGTLLPVGAGGGPRAIGEHLLERMLVGGATKLCFVVPPDRADVLAYFGPRFGPAPVSYVVQPRPSGACDALFRAGPLVAEDEAVLVGSSDLLWFPVDGFLRLPTRELSLLLFQVERPERFEAVLTRPDGRVREIRVRSRDPVTRWVWGALALPSHVLHELAGLWSARERRDAHLGTLIDAWIAAGGRARGIHAGEELVDVAALDGHRDAMRLLATHAPMADTAGDQLRGSTSDSRLGPRSSRRV